MSAMLANSNMFRFLVIVLTATTFVAHGLLGCCWHHLHAACASQSEAGHHDGVAEGHESHQHESLPGEDSHRHQNCDEADCIFVCAPQKGPVNCSLLALIDALPAFLAPASPAVVFESIVGSITGGELCADAAPRHARCSVWLI